MQKLPPELVGMILKIKYKNFKKRFFKHCQEMLIKRGLRIAQHFSLLTHDIGSVKLEIYLCEILGCMCPYTIKKNGNNKYIKNLALDRRCRFFERFDGHLFRND